MEREILQQEKAQLLRMERKKIEQEQIEIKKKIEEARRAVKRPHPHHDDRRDQYDDRKRMHRYDMHQVMEFANKYKEEKARVDVRMQRDAREDIRAARDERERLRLREEIRAREDFVKRDRGDFAPPPPRLSGSTSTQIKYSDSRQYSDDPRLTHELIRRGEALVAAATMSMARSNTNSGNNIGKDLRYVEVGNPHDIMPNTYPGQLIDMADNRRGMVPTNDHDHHRSHRNYDIKG